jgi:hypothetical protein
VPLCAEGRRVHLPQSRLPVRGFLPRRSPRPTAWRPSRAKSAQRLRLAIVKPFCESTEHRRMIRTGRAAVTRLPAHSFRSCSRSPSAARIACARTSGMPSAAPRHGFLSWTRIDARGCGTPSMSSWSAPPFVNERWITLRQGPVFAVLLSRPSCWPDEYCVWCHRSQVRFRALSSIPRCPQLCAPSRHTRPLGHVRLPRLLERSLLRTKCLPTVMTTPALKPQVVLTHNGPGSLRRDGTQITRCVPRRCRPCAAHKTVCGGTSSATRQWMRPLFGRCSRRS